MRSNTRVSLVLSAIAAGLLLLPAVAWAYPNTSFLDQFPNVTCDECHSRTSTGGTSDWDGSGPHKNFATTTTKCALCHSVHSAPAGSILLLSGPTITASCLHCHDGTGADVGVYKTITAHGGTVRSDHLCESTNVIPGGSTALTANLDCADCHAPHGANTVTAFMRDSGRALASDVAVTSDCLLRRDVNGQTVADYGAGWCAACHDQRHSSNSSGVRNHPVGLDTDWVYRTVTSTLTADTWHPENPAYGGTGIAVGMGRTNSAYIMGPVASSGDGRIEEINRKSPICQQCHEDARIVTNVFQGDYTHRGDPVLEPWNAPVNPEFLTFPHQTTNVNMLAETQDDLCLNCHLVSALP